MKKQVPSGQAPHQQGANAEHDRKRSPGGPLPQKSHTPQTRPTARGVIVLMGSALLIVAGHQTALAALLALGLAGVAICLLAAGIAIWTQTALRRASIHVTRTVRPATPLRGGSAIVTVKVHGSRISRALITRTDATIRDHVDDHLARRGGNVTLRVGQHGWEAAYYIEPWARGRWDLGPVRLRFTDYLGLEQTSLRLEQHTTLAVGPKIAAITRGASHRDVTDRSVGDVMTHGSRSPSADDALLREYVPGDDVRRVHWPSTARRRTLMVRSDESTPITPVAVILDGRLIARNPSRGLPLKPERWSRLGHRKLGATPEYEATQWPIDFTASVLQAFVSAGHHVRLDISATLTSRLNRQASDADALHLLTDLPEEPVPSSADLLVETILGSGFRSAIVVLGSLPPEAAAIIARRAHHAAPGALRAVVVAEWGDHDAAAVAQTVATLHQAGWEVRSAHPDDDLVTVTEWTVAS